MLQLLDLVLWEKKDMRDLNTEKFDPDGIVSVSSNEFSLGTGRSGKILNIKF